MSLKPPKHSEMKWPDKRESRKRKISLDYNLIVTEGTKTEPKYFEALKEHINKNENNRIQLEIIGSGKNTRDLFEYAKSLVSKSPNGYSNVWLVYDLDDFPIDRFNVTQTLCENNSIEDGTTYHAIWSNECIELWFLLHFSYMQSNLHRFEYFPKLTECLDQHGEYKKNREDLFDVLLPYLDTAIENAEKLSKENIGRTPADSAPGTKMFEMMKKFKPYL